MIFCFPKFSTNFTDKELNKKLIKLNFLNGNQFSDSKFKRIENDKTLDLITEIIYKSSSEQLETHNPYPLISCTIKILITHIKTPFQFSSVISKRKHRRKYQQAKNNYIKLIKLFKANKEGEIVNIVIDVLHKEKLWQFKYVSVEIIKTVLDHGYNGAVVCNEICEKIKLCEKTMDPGITLIVKVLYGVLGTYSWPENESTVIFLKRFLNLYLHILNDNHEEPKKSFFNKLKTSIDLCLRQIIKNISNYHLLIVIQHMSAWSTRKDVNDNFILNYSSTLEYAASMHTDDFLMNILNGDILPLLMKMIRSKLQIVSLLGNRIFQHLIDRGKNVMLFISPTIFFEDVKLKIFINKYYKEDRQFMKQHRELIHNSLIESFLNHRYNRLNLETTYCTCCLIALEIPCGFTAAALSCLMMTVQEIIRNHGRKYGSKEANFHIHAIIISVLSFVCWIYKAKDFHQYVNTILMERAQWAPHLNPPLKSNYNFAVHHILWDKDELFFVNWEVRYGLWRRFRLDQNLTIRTKSLVYDL